MPRPQQEPNRSANSFPSIQSVQLYHSFLVSYNKAQCSVMAYERVPDPVSHTFLNILTQERCYPDPKDKRTMVTKPVTTVTSLLQQLDIAHKLYCTEAELVYVVCYTQGQQLCHLPHESPVLSSFQPTTEWLASSTTTVVAAAAKKAVRSAVKNGM